MSDPLATLKVIMQVVGISAASALAGASGAQSIIAMPAILKASPAVSVKQFGEMSHASMGVLKPFLMGSTAVFSVLTYLSYTPSETRSITTLTQWKLFAVASLSAFAVIPYTVINLAPLAHKLEGFATKVDSKSSDSSLTASEGEDVKSTLAEWAKLNQGRALLPFIASVTALVASLAY